MPLRTESVAKPQGLRRYSATSLLMDIYYRFINVKATDVIGGFKHFVDS